MKRDAWVDLRHDYLLSVTLADGQEWETVIHQAATVDQAHQRGLTLVRAKFGRLVGFQSYTVRRLDEAAA